MSRSLSLEHKGSRALASSSPHAVNKLQQLREARDITCTSHFWWGIFRETFARMIKVTVTSVVLIAGVWITNWVPSDLLESFVPIERAREWIWTLKIVPVCSTFCLQSAPFKSNSVSMVTAVQQDNTFIKSQISGHHHIVLLLTYEMNTFIPDRTNILGNFNNYSKLHSAFPSVLSRRK